jgi:hypothetical protein
MFWAMFILHIIGMFFFWQYSFSNPADSTLYYNDPLNMYNRDGVTGTVFVIKLVREMKDIFGGYYLEYFLLFQAFGIAGLALMIRSLDDILSDLDVKPDIKIIFPLFLPGWYFWTVSLSKDAPLFFALSLSIWSMIKIERRYLGFVVALAVMFPFRPHIAAFASIALLVTLIFDVRVRILAKIPMILLALSGAIWAATTVERTLGIGALDADSISEFLASKQEIGLRSVQGTELYYLPLPLKIASLLFRPLFFDAKGLLGYIVSIENILVLYIFMTIAFRWRDLFRLFLSVPYVRFCAIFATLLIVLLSLVTYNVGLGLRQKYMAMPAIVLLYVTLLVYRRAKEGSTLQEGLEQDLPDPRTMAPRG